MSARKKPAKKRKLRLEKRPLEEQVEDLDVDDEEATDIKGGFAPPYVPVIPSRSVKDQVTRPNLPGTSGFDQSGPTRGG